MKARLWAVLLALLIVAGARLETIRLRNGTRFSAQVLSCTPTVVVVSAGRNKTLTLYWKNLDPQCAEKLFRRYARNVSLVDLGQFYLQIGKPERASRYFDQAVTADPRSERRIRSILKAYARQVRIWMSPPETSPKTRRMSSVPARRGRFWILETRHFIVRSEYSARSAVELAQVAEDLYRRFARTFHISTQTGSAQLWSGKLDLFVFSSEKDFVAHALSLGFLKAYKAGGYFNLHRDKVLVSIAPPRTTEKKRRIGAVLTHELAHAFLEYYYKPDSVPAWVHEGVAQHFEYLFDPSARKFVRFSQELRLSPPSLEDVKRVVMLDNIPPTDIDAYRVSWGFVSYLLSFPNKRFSYFVRLMKDGVPEQLAFERAFGKSRSELARRWIRSLAGR